MSKVANLFDAWAKTGRAEGMEAGHGQTASGTLAALKITPGMEMLDLGMGNGWASRYAATKGAKAVGIDLSQEMVDRANAAAPAGARYVQGDFANMPFEDGQFDLIWSMEALYYAPDVDKVMREIARVCAPNAEAHILIDFYGENTASHSWPEDVGVPMSLMTSDEWLAMLAEVGFKASANRLLSTDEDAEQWKKVEGTLHLVARKK
jgi:ubiquinone/menaquinone biosynthesis C-methylase UbiE